eukprot:scaffold2052_cov106-Isochrysis_galbana.AAC.1
MCRRHRRAPRDPRLHHQRLRAPPQGGAQVLFASGAASTAQGSLRGHVPPAAVVLRHPVRGEGPQAG